MSQNSKNANKMSPPASLCAAGINYAALVGFAYVLMNKLTSEYPRYAFGSLLSVVWLPFLSSISVDVAQRITPMTLTASAVVAFVLLLIAWRCQKTWVLVCVNGFMFINIMILRAVLTIAFSDGHS